MKKVAVLVNTVAVPSVYCKACGCRKAQVGKYVCELCERREQYNESVQQNIEAIENGQGSEKET